jgi:hypothetical protein
MSYTKTCKQCGTEFTTHKKNKTLCSVVCQKDNQRRMNREYAQRNAETAKLRVKEWRDNLTEEQRAKVNDQRNERRAPAQAETKEEAKRLRPVLDTLDLTPENLPHIEAMIDYIEGDDRLAFLLDWHWLSDAKEYLDEQQ